MRGQTSLPALALAFLLLTGGLVVAITAAGSALDSAERPALDRQAAFALSERLVDPGAPVTARANVLNATKLAALTVAQLRTDYGLADDVAVRVRVNEQAIATAGNPHEGVTIERVVLVERRQERTIEPALGWSRRVTLPRRTDALRVTIKPPANATVRGLSVDGRTRLWNASGLRGTFDLPLSRAQAPSLQFDASGSLSPGSVRVQYYPTRTEKARLEVTLDG